MFDRVLARRGAALPAPRRWPRAIGHAAARAFLAERTRWSLWLAVALGVGTWSYFALPVEPPSWLGAAAVGLPALAALWGWHLRARGTAVLFLAAIVVTAGGLGFAAAQLRAARATAPVLEKRWGPGMVSGRVVAAATLPEGLRLVLDRVTLAGIAPARTPARIRVRVRRRAPRDNGPARPSDLAPGDRVRLRALLFPPPAPSAPGAFDFQRHAWFLRLGAVGIALGRPRLVKRAEDQGLALWWAGVRQTIAARVRAARGDRAGTVAAALLTGDRAAIPETALVAMRSSGLAHLLAISGLHIGLVAGILFFGIRAGLALVPGLALRRPIKKWAALAALAGAFGYLLVSGATVPTQRAYVMIGLVFLAVLLDRTAMSMRLVAWAAALVLLLAPESILGASFQMSFAAVVALIAAYETLASRLLRRAGGRERGLWRRVALYLAGIGLTTLVASAATSVFAIYHFNRLAAYGLAANLVAVPLMGFWIMPWGLVALALMPLGLERLALAPMGAGIELMLRIAETVAGWSGAVTLVPAMPAAGLALAVFGGLWLCLWRGRWRRFGLLGVVAALVTIPLARPPDILVTGDARLLAVRGADGRYMLSTHRAERFAAEGWLRRAGQDEANPWPRKGQSRDGRLRCDAAGCIYRARGHVVALIRDERALAEDCAMAEVVVSVEPVRLPCPAARVVVDRIDLWRDGGYAIWLEANGVRVESVNGNRGTRPWVPRPASRRRPRRASRRARAAAP